MLSAVRLSRLLQVNPCPTCPEVLRPFGRCETTMLIELAEGMGRLYSIIASSAAVRDRPLGRLNTVTYLAVCAVGSSTRRACVGCPTATQDMRVEPPAKKPCL